MKKQVKFMGWEAESGWHIYWTLAALYGTVCLTLQAIAVVSLIGVGIFTSLH
jgi:hypothetical protein